MPPLILTLFLLIVSVKAVPVANIGQSSIIGAEFLPANVEFFGGIPFALPPLGELRLQPPILSKTLAVKTLHAEGFGPGCLQLTSNPDSVSEDCLSLNIFRPSGTSHNDKLPVMVWFYGGGFFTGSSSLYNGTGIVTHSVNRGTPVIYVSFNYRLGPLGFPQGVEAGQRGILNLGLHDQLTALEWIQENIPNFGGDASKVTVFGQSAGATSLSIHLRETRIGRLARAAILESTPVGPTFGPTREAAAWENFVSVIPNCTSLADTGNTIDCVRGADTGSIFKALTAVLSSSSSSFGPVIDGPGGLIVARPSQVVSEAKLPLLIGTNLDEGTLFTPQATNSTVEIRAFLNASTSPSLVSPAEQERVIDQILDLYTDDPSLGSPFMTGNDTFGLNSQYKRFAAIFGDFIIQSTTRTIEQNTSGAGVKVFGYLFTDPDSVAIPDLLTPDLAPGSVGVPHSAEIFYVFGTLANKTPTATALSSIMQDYWISFATSLDPNDNHGITTRPRWQSSTASNQMIMELNGHDTKLIPNTFRAAQIAVFQDNPDALHR